MYFEKITVKGEGKTDSVIEFRQGVNIVQGRSNTGKTAIIRCIDFALGSKKLPIDESFGYNEVELTIATPKGQVIINRLFHKGQVTVTTTIPDAENGVYDLKKTKNNKHPILSDLLLNTMGIDTPCEVIQNADFKKQKLYIRTFLGMLMYIHTEIGREISIIEPVESTAKTPFLSALLLLLNDENLSGAQTQTKFEIRVARKKAVEDYINKRICATAKKRNDLEDQMKLFEGVNVEASMQQLLDDIKSIEAQIQESLNKRRELIDRIRELQEKDSESGMLLSRYHELHTQYKADISRLNFIVDGEIVTKGIPQNTTCPFCESTITARKRESYIDSARAELSRIILQLNGLTELESEITDERKSIEDETANLKEEKKRVEQLIEEKLQPKVDSLQESLAQYRAYFQLKKELDVIKGFATDLETDLRVLPEEKESDVKYRPREYFDSKFQENIDKLYMDILTECCFDPPPTAARFNISSFDVEIDGHKKTNYQGLGYCAFINTVTALVFRKYFADTAQYDPGFLIVDTPLLGLDQGVDDVAPESMRTGLFRYIMKQKDIGQIIILENLKHIPKLDFESEGVNLITFTKGYSEGRYGFLNDVT